MSDFNSAAADNKDVFKSGPFLLDLRESRLTRDGEDTGLTGKPLYLLAALMSAPQQLLTKDEIFEQVWLGRAVSEAVLTTAIRQIRAALGDNARQPTIVETVHGRGYRFMLPVEKIDGESAEAGPPAVTPPKSRRFPLAWGALAAACLAAIATAAVLLAPSRSDDARRVASTVASVASEKSLAIRPFANNGAETGEEWFAEGLTWEILTTLSKTPDIRIAPMTAAAKLEAPKFDAQSFGRELGVAYVLEGIVRREEQTVRVTASLTRASDGVVVWADNFDRAEDDVISIQEEIACDIGRALGTMLDPKKLHNMVAAGTQSPAAYNAYLQGVAYGKRALAEGGADYVRKSADAFEQARELDPDFAAAQWAAAQSWFGNTTRVDSKAFDGVVSREEQLAKFFERVDAAIAASGDNVDALKYRSARAVMRLQFNPALDLLKKYLKSRPRDIEAWEQLSAVAVYAGDRATAALAARRMHALSMEQGEVMSRAVTVSVMALELKQAEKIVREQLALSPENAVLNYQAQRVFLWSDNFVEAQRSLEYVRSSTLDDVTIALAEIRQACAEGRIADVPQWRAIVDEQGPLGARWQAAMLTRDHQAVRKLLEPYDTPDGLPTLMQFLFQPVFDEQQFPVLAERLKIEGISRQPAIEMPKACRLTPSFAAN